jgi:hypothetical protein
MAQGRKLMEINSRKIIISGIDIPFTDLVFLLVKIALASIPAMIIIYFVFALFTMFFGGVFNIFMFRGML